MLGWLRAATGAIAARFEGVRNRTISLIADWLTNTPWLLSSAFWTLATKAYGGNAVVYACVRLLSQSIPEAPMRCYQEEADGNRTLLDRDHPLCQLIAHPNELMTEYEFWELTTIHLAAAGQSFWWKERANSGQILALWPLRPDRISPLYSDSTKPGERVIAGWNYQDPSTGEFSPIPRRDVLSFNLPSPASERNRADSGGIVEGLGPLQVLAAEISADNEATSFVGALLKNYAAPTVALRVKAAVRSQEDADLLKSKFKAQFGGARRGDPALLDADTEIQMIGFNLEQLEFPDLRAVAESRIAAALGVPAILVGLKAGLDRSTFSNMAESRSYFAETTLANYWRRYSDQMANDLAPEFGEGIVCEFDTSNVRALAGQRIERIQPLKDGFGAGAVTRGEYRAALGLEAREGDDVYVMPANTIEVPAALAVSPVASRALRYDPSQPRDSEGKFGSGGGSGKTPKRGKYVIAESEAKDFLKGSKNQTITIHGTNAASAEKLKKFGPDVSKNRGAALGPGLYTSGIHQTEYGSVGLRVAVRLENPIMAKSGGEAMRKVDSLTRGARSAVEANKMLLNAGYDGVMVKQSAGKGSPPWVVAFKGENIRIIE